MSSELGVISVRGKDLKDSREVIVAMSFIEIKKSIGSAFACSTFFGKSGAKNSLVPD